MKLVLALFILINVNLSFAKTSKKFMSYSEAADIFMILENLSEWYDGAKREYRIEFQKQFELDDSDITQFQIYKSFRSRFYKSKSSLEMSNFSHMDRSLDIISHAFLSSSTIDEALSYLQKKIDKKDVVLLASIFKHFQPKIGAWAKESRAFDSKIKTLSNQIKKDKVAKVVKDVANFLGVKKIKIKVRFAWWPQTNSPVASFYGNYVILHFNPVTQLSSLNSSVIVEATVAGLLRAVGTDNLNNFSKSYFSSCPIKEKIKKLPMESYLERPLILSMSHLYHGNIIKKKKFNVFEKWDTNDFVNLLAKDFFFQFLQAKRSKEKFGTDYGQKLSGICQTHLNSFETLKSLQ